jgi:hypothetical protein
MLLLPLLAIHRRASIAQETVVLANCIDNNGIQSSQMAYFVGAPNASPNAVVNVPTDPGKTVIWEGNTTPATFPDGVTFSATILKVVAEGEYAGPGKNNYGTFSCWAHYVPNMYKTDSRTCTAVYVCDHAGTPGMCFRLFLRYDL